MRHARRVLTLCAVIHVAQAGSALPTPPPAYEALLRQYAAGDREAATTEIASWPERRLRDAVRAASSLAASAALCPRGDCVAALQWSRFPVAAALMLHTDASIRLRAAGASPKLHESAAAEFAKLAHADPARRTFVRNWYAAMALRAQAEVRWSDALDWAERGLKTDPDAVDLLLVVASVEEVLASQTSSPPTVNIFDAGARRLRTAIALGRDKRTHLERAREAVRVAVGEATDRDDAGVRLGRIAWKLGDMAEARASLERVLARGVAGPASYLAHLFLGRVYEDEDRLEDAARSYEAASAVETRNQTARLALSHLRLLQGDATRARQELESAIRPAGFRRPKDPFWLYPWGASDEAEARLEALRRESTS